MSHFGKGHFVMSGSNAPRARKVTVARRKKPKRRHPMRLLITGSRHGFPGLAEALDAFVAAFGRPLEVHVRGQRGVDTEARAWVAARGLVLVPEASDPTRPSPDRYHEANARMVAKCKLGDIAIGFPAPGSKGTWQCLHLARKAGLICYVADPRTKKINLWSGTW